jgi:hypothetical protein
MCNVQRDFPTSGSFTRDFTLPLILPTERKKVGPDVGTKIKDNLRIFLNIIHQLINLPHIRDHSTTREWSRTGSRIPESPSSTRESPKGYKASPAHPQALLTYSRQPSNRTASRSWKALHFEDLFCIRNRVWLYDSASFAASSRHINGFFVLRKPALRSVDCKSFTAVIESARGQ